MARIEISLDEYNGLRRRIKDLEAIVASTNAEMNILLSQRENLQEGLEIALNASWLERCFQWNAIKEIINDNNITVDSKL